MRSRIERNALGDEPKGSEITPEREFFNRPKSRRGFTRLLTGAAGLTASAVAFGGMFTGDDDAVASAKAAASGGALDDALTPEDIVTGYNNFYEFGMDKTDPARYAHEMTIAPWTVDVSGRTEAPRTWNLEDLLKELAVEDRVYRFRCVEAWSMVVPWQGIPLARLIERLKPSSDARFVEFQTLHRPDEMRGQRSWFSSIDWPYVEGLRMDEAMHPLSLMAVGVYGKPLPNQNGAPLRLIVPWKYGFKSIKSIVSIRFRKRQPRNTWSLLAPREYGFYANVNPDVSHPRWSQATERRLPSTFLDPNRRPTLPFNGYAEQVTSLYTGMDLRRNF